jgi:alpha-soluble NSF attachment protein
LGKYSCLEAADALFLSVNLLTERGRFSAAANNQKQIAEIYETDLVDYEKAMLAYEQAADWYLAEDSSAYIFLNIKE